MYDFKTSQAKMLENQLLASNLISYDIALKTASIPRELFLPETMKSKAYIDEDIKVDDDYFLISSLSLARLIAVADVSPSDVVLDLACGLGYSSAVLSKFAGMVVGIDKKKQNEAIATHNFAELSLDNAVLISSDTPESGLKSQAPYDIIMIAGMIDKIPEELFEQLANGGRLVTACLHNNKKYGNDFYYYGEITKVIKKGRAFDKKTYADILMPKLSINFKK